MRAYLVGSACQQFDLDKAVFAVEGQDAVLCAYLLGAFDLGFVHRDLVLALVFRKVSAEDIAVLAGLAVNKAEVVFLDLPCFHLLVQYPQSLGVFRGNDNTARVAVDAVYERG